MNKGLHVHHIFVSLFPFIPFFWTDSNRITSTDRKLDPPVKVWFLSFVYLENSQEIFTSPIVKNKKVKNIMRIHSNSDQQCKTILPLN
jgi:hypothetical protein